MTTDVIIQLTEAAECHIKKIIHRRGSGVGFRLSVKETGCSGFMYKPEVVDDIRSEDLQVLTSQGLLVLIDPACVNIIKGTTVDYVQKSLGQQQLLFKNPNVVSECGCGESFKLKEEGPDE